MSSRSKSALVVEGGAMRGIFSAGVLDVFIQKKFNPFDICIGASAGSLNIAAYLAMMYQRNYKIFTDYSLNPEFISIRKFIMGGHLLDLDWMWDLTIREVRLDLKKIMSSKKNFLIAVTNAKTGEPEYLAPKMNNLEDMLKASSSIPLFYRGFIEIDGVPYTDGGLADPIPVREACNRGAKNILVVRSRPKSYVMKNANKFINKIIFRESARLVEAANARPIVYNESVEFLRNPPKGVRVIEINPPEGFKTGRLTKDISLLQKGYDSGLETGTAVIAEWKKLTRAGSR